MVDLLGCVVGWLFGCCGWFSVVWCMWCDGWMEIEVDEDGDRFTRS